MGWYFLFAYAILRSIPNKLGGVIALVASVAILYTLRFGGGYNIKGMPFYHGGKPLFWRFCGLVVLLTWIGARPVEDPYIIVGQVLTLTYFLYFGVFLGAPLIKRRYPLSRSLGSLNFTRPDLIAQFLT